MTSGEKQIQKNSKMAEKHCCRFSSVPLVVLLCFGGGGQEVAPEQPLRKIFTKEF